MEWTLVAAIGWTAGVFPFRKAPLDEERRLGYVCATRARQFLHISWTTRDALGNDAGPSGLVAEGRVEEVAETYPASPCDKLVLPPGALAPAVTAPTWGKAIGQ